MTNTELKNRYNEISKIICNLWLENKNKWDAQKGKENNKHFIDSKLYRDWVNQEKLLKKEQRDIAVQFNKNKHLYWDRQDWIKDVVATINAPVNLTGQALNRYYVDAINNLKLSGCLAFDDTQDEKYKTWGATIIVFTEHKVYIYGLTRGYCGQLTIGNCQQSWNTKEICDSQQDMFEKWRNLEY